MVSLTFTAHPSGFGILLQHVVDIDANRILVHQPAAEIAGNCDKQAAEHRQINALWQYCRGGIWQPLQPVQGGQRQQHDRQDGMTPGSDQAADLAYQQQIKQTCQSGYPSTYRTHASKPKAGSGPERIVAAQKSHIGCDKPNQSCDGKMYQPRVQRMAKNNDLTGNRLHRHSELRGCLTKNKMRWFRPSVAAVSAAALLAALTGCSGPFSALDPKGPAAAEVSLFWWGMFAVATLVLLGVVALWLYAIKRRPQQNDAASESNSWLWWGALALPLACITVLLAFGIPAGQRMAAFADSNALQIDVTGHQWYWQVKYRGYAIEMTNELHIPVATAVYLNLRSADVIHSFWVPRLGVKLDMLPGRTNLLKLEASEPGVYRGQCAEYCGLGHAHMQFTVKAHDKEAFVLWLNAQQREERRADD